VGVRFFASATAANQNKRPFHYTFKIFFDVHLEHSSIWPSADGKGSNYNKRLVDTTKSGS
jgi:hypothetical protein